MNNHENTLAGSGLTMQWNSLLLATLLTWIPSTGSAQIAGRIAGEWNGCFTADRSPGPPVCGRIVLDGARACPMGFNGYYFVPFGDLVMIDTLTGDFFDRAISHDAESGQRGQVRPPREATFTWSEPVADSLTLTRTLAVMDFADGTGSACALAEISNFEVAGRLAGDSIAGVWGWYKPGGGFRRNGTVVMKKRR